MGLSLRSLWEGSVGVFDGNLGGGKGRREVSGRKREGDDGKERTNEEKISPKNAFSFPMRGSVFVNSVCALA